MDNINARGILYLSMISSLASQQPALDESGLAQAVRQMMDQSLGPCFRCEATDTKQPTWTVFGEAEYAHRVPRDTTGVAQRNKTHLKGLIKDMQLLQGNPQIMAALGPTAEDVQEVESEGEMGFRRLRFKLPGYNDACEVCGCSE